MTKKFAIAEEDIKPVAEGRGACFATDRIVVDGEPVGYCYREAPDFDEDGGWRFFAGDESEDYVNDPANLGVYDINTIANYDPDIIPLLDYLEGSAFERRKEGGEFVRVEQ